MEKLVLYVKGIAIGIANVVAGLSGGTIAILCGVYERFVSLFSDFFSHPKKVLKENIGFILGILSGFVLGAIILSKLYKKYPLQVSFLFCGLILTSIPFIAKKIKKDYITYKEVIGFLISFSVVVVLPFLTKGAKQEINLDFTTGFIVFFLGMVAMGTMIIPGVSGSMILALLGYYAIYDLIFIVISAVFHGEWAVVGENIALLVIFGLGCVIGVVLVAKCVKVVLKKFESIAMSTILGLVSGSCISIIVLAIRTKDYFVDSWKTPVAWGVSVLLFAVGVVSGLLLEKYGNKKPKREIDYLNISKIKLPEAEAMLSDLIGHATVLKEFDPNSDTPFGLENAKALEYVLSKASQDGFKTFQDGNYAGHIEFGAENGELIGVLVHLDVVPTEGQAWDSDPFIMVKKDGRYYGRGVEDDKGPLVASYYALKIIKESGLPVRKRVRLIIGCDEESGSRCLAHYFKTQEVPRTGFSPDAEFPLIYGEKANASFDIVGTLDENEIITEFVCGERYNIVPALAKMKLSKNYETEFVQFLEKNNYEGFYSDGYYTALGVGAHAMVPQNGLNAAFVLFEFLNEVHPTTLSEYVVKYLTFDPYGTKLGIDIYDEDMKELTLNVGFVQIQQGSFRFGINARIPANDYENSIMKAVEDSFGENKNFHFKLLYCSTCHFVDPKSELVEILMNAYRDITKDEINEPFTIGGGTYARFIKQAVAFGPMFPGSPDVCHIANEFMEVEDFIKSMAIYTKAVYDLIK